MSKITVKTKDRGSKKQWSTGFLAAAAMIAALYMLLCLPFASFSFGIVQFRLAEALTVLPAFTPAAVPGLFLGCFLSNLLNPQNLGLVDILGGSLTTLLAAGLTYFIGKPYRELLAERKAAPGKTLAEGKVWKLRVFRFLPLLPPVLLNALIVGYYLPYLLMDSRPTFMVIVGSIGSILLSESLVIFVIGTFLMLGLERLPIPWRKFS